MSCNISSWNVKTSIFVAINCFVIILSDHGVIKWNDSLMENQLLWDTFNEMQNRIMTMVIYNAIDNNRITTAAMNNAVDNDMLLTTVKNKAVEKHGMMTVVIYSI